MRQILGKNGMYLKWNGGEFSLVENFFNSIVMWSERETRQDVALVN
jgi:hypothetical protein